MTTLNEARERVYQEFVDNFAATSNITFDNERYDPPADEDWVRLTVRHAGRGQESLGPETGRKFESVASAIVQCFAPLDSGAKGADTLAQAAMVVFEGKTIGPTERLRFTSAVPTEIGATKDGYYQTNVEAFFTYTETK